MCDERNIDLYNRFYYYCFISGVDEENERTCIVETRYVDESKTLRTEENEN